jgi:hypothetical protein
VTAITAGYNFCLALKKDGTVWGWGRNQYFGELGVGHNKTLPIGSVVQVNGLADVVAIDAGADFSLAVTGDGRVWAWGGNSSGQLGTQESEFTEDRYEPVCIIGLTGVVSVSAGYLHSLALKSDGTAWAWGSNCNGQLGNGSCSSCYSFARPVNNLDDVVQIAAGGSHNLALKGDGSIWAWGSNTSGELGIDADQNSSIPVKVSGITGARAITAGGRHSLALISPAATTPPPASNENQVSAAPTPIPTGATSTPVATRYTLMINISGTGAAEGVGTYEPGTEVDIAANPGNDEWYFSGWISDISIIDDHASAHAKITVNQNCTITANFKQKDKPGFPAWLPWAVIGVIAFFSVAVFAVISIFKRKIKQA